MESRSAIAIAEGNVARRPIITRPVISVGRRAIRGSVIAIARVIAGSTIARIAIVARRIITPAIVARRVTVPTIRITAVMTSVGMPTLGRCEAARKNSNDNEPEKSQLFHDSASIGDQ